MGYSRDEILKAWDQAIVRSAEDASNPTDDEIAVALAEVRTKCAGLKVKDVEEALVARRVKTMEDAIFDGLPKGVLTFGEAVQLKSKQGNETALELLDAPIFNTDEPKTSPTVDVEEVARAMAQMFTASAELGEEEPDLDLILDVLGENFPGITMGHISNAGEIMVRGSGDPLPGLSGGPPIKHGRRRR